MSFPRYQSYKQTSSAWLRTIPEHWEMGQSRRRFRLRNEPAQEEDEQLTASQKHGIIRQAEFIESEGRRVVEVIKGQDILKHVEPGDFVISMRSFQGGLEYSRVKGSISSAYVMLAPVKQVEPGFFAWLFKSQSYIQALQATTNLVRDGQALRFSNFCQVDIPIVPDKEQLAIASFLDSETAKIDALIAEQQRLIELLQEKRQAVISHAVTKGLNPNAPMKDSGVEWLGEVPEHWTGCRFKHCLLGLTDAEHKTCPDYSEGEHLIIRTSNIRDGALVLDNAKYTDINGYKEWTARCTPQAGDIVFTREAPAGEACIIPEGITACLGQRTVLMHPSPSRVIPEYLVSSIYSGAARTFVQNLSQGSTVSHLNMSEIGNMPIALPPLEEQLCINKYTREEGRKFHELIQQAHSLINLLQERRSALISAAVTGQIDVRGLVKEEEP